MILKTLRRLKYLRSSLTGQPVTLSADNQLGSHNFNLISGSNELGLGVEEEFTKLRADVVIEITELKAKVEQLAATPSRSVEQDAEFNDAKEQLYIKEAHLKRLDLLHKDKSLFTKAGYDDIIVKEIHLPINEPVVFKFRARDVIHSAYLAAFPCADELVCRDYLPSLPLRLPKLLLICVMNWAMTSLTIPWYGAKICGAAHYNMKIKVVVESERLMLNG